MRGRISSLALAMGLGVLLVPLLVGWVSAQQDTSGDKSAGSKKMTVIHIATSASSPADAKRIATGFAMARHSAEAGRDTIVYLNGAAAKLATQGLALADEVSGELQLDDSFSMLKQDGVQVYAATTDVSAAEVSKDSLHAGVKPLAPVDLFKKITPETVVLSF